MITGRQTTRPHQLRFLVAIESRLSSHLGWLKKIRRQSLAPLGSRLLFSRNANTGGHDFLPILNFSFAEITFGDQHV
jgi:hypothetical protein